MQTCKSIDTPSDLQQSATPQQLYFTTSFDGSRSFRMWFETLELARELSRQAQQPVHFTYFINGIYYDHESPRNCGFGQSQSKAETLTRWAITQQAINEGHEIGNHSYHHAAVFDESCKYHERDFYTPAFWNSDIAKMDQLVANNLFEPVLGPDEMPIFPAWEALPGQGELGNACSGPEQCKSKTCLTLNSKTKVCAQPCKTGLACPQGFSCGGPDWTEQTDLCVLNPRFPVRDPSGFQLFSANGEPNIEAVKSGKLRPYRMKGMRAPFLQTHNLFPALAAQNYRYDASEVYLSIPRPFRIPGTQLMEFPVSRLDKREIGLPQYPLWPLPFNTEYDGKRDLYSEADMVQHFKESILWAYKTPKTNHWNIGSHFSPWRDNKVVYFDAIKEVLNWSVTGCEGGCAGAKHLSFIETLNEWDSIPPKPANPCNLFTTTAVSRCRDFVSNISTCLGSSKGLTICNSFPMGHRIIGPDKKRLEAEDPNFQPKNVICATTCNSQNIGFNDGCNGVVERECP
jgi:hypothetical protein